jgi:hypothetical protein
VARGEAETEDEEANRRRVRRFVDGENGDGLYSQGGGGNPGTREARRKEAITPSEREAAERLREPSRPEDGVARFRS